MFCVQRLKYIALFLLFAFIIFGCGKEPADLVFDNPNDPLSPNYLEKNNNTNTGQPQFTGKDGAPMVLITAGEFQMGSNDGSESEKPVHTVYLDAFYMDKYKVTNMQYSNFLNEYGKNTDNAERILLNIYSGDCFIEKTGNVYKSKVGYENHPVFEVSWYGALTYAQFYNKRLPTEAEWEKSARGGSSISPNGYGLYDMVGKTWEWVSDWLGSDYYGNSPKNNPQGADGGVSRIRRGGNNSVTVRGCDYPRDSHGFLGFRCMMDIPK
jgi:formylglycine-generating enzyme